MDDRRSLPPMTTIEFAIDAAFRHFFFGLGLLLGWAVLLLPLEAFAWYAVFRNGPPDFKALPPMAIAAAALLGIGVLVASFSMEVNWNRRILLGERPGLLRRWRLDRPVWRYAGGAVLMLVVLALYAGAGFAVMTQAVPALSPQIAGAAKPLGIAVTVLIGLSGLFTFYRLMSWLAGRAVGAEDYTLRSAWRATRGNRIAFLAFTFWLIFSLAIAGGVGAGAFFAQQALPQPWVKPAALAVIAVVGWLALLFLHSLPAALHRAFR